MRIKKVGEKYDSGDLRVRLRVPALDEKHRFSNMETHRNGAVKYGTIVLIAIMAGLAAVLSSLGNATIDQFGLSGIKAADIWWIIVGIAAFLGSSLAMADVISRGKY